MLLDALLCTSAWGDAGCIWASVLIVLTVKGAKCVVPFCSHIIQRGSLLKGKVPSESAVWIYERLSVLGLRMWGLDLRT